MDEPASDRLFRASAVIEILLVMIPASSFPTNSIILKNIAPTPGADLRDLRYLTNRTGINDYVAIFFKEQENVKNDVLSIAGIKDYITVNLKTVTKNKIEVIDKINIKSNIKIEEE